MLLLWKMHQRIRRTNLPAARIVVEFDFIGRGGRRLWLVLERHDVSVCLRPPGFDADLTVRADLAYFYRVWLGQVDYHAAVRAGQIVVGGRPSLARELPRWFMWSPMARHVRAARDRRPAGRGADARRDA